LQNLRQKYHWYHFSGTDWDAANERKAIFQLKGEGKSWSESVDDEDGNADYMMFADLDYSHPEVQEDVKNWGPWVTKEVGLKGFRLDAVQHFSQRFTNEWVEHVRKECGDDIFMVGEFWTNDTEAMSRWLDEMHRKFSLFDAPLLYNFSRLSTTEAADLRTVFDNTLVKRDPLNAVVSSQTLPRCQYILLTLPRLSLQTMIRKKAKQWRPRWKAGSSL
jgi:alpha-amylase